MQPHPNLNLTPTPMLYIKGSGGDYDPLLNRSTSEVSKISWSRQRQIIAIFYSNKHGYSFILGFWRSSHAFCERLAESCLPLLTRVIRASAACAQAPNTRRFNNTSLLKMQNGKKNKEKSYFWKISLRFWSQMKLNKNWILPTRTYFWLHMKQFGKYF